MRGEHVVFGLDSMAGLGSSPHARGTQECRQCEGDRQGIIPACAGNTIYKYFSFSCGRDHPRMRGEHASTQAEKLSTAGSSPHARGTHAHAVGHQTGLGIIPACAGNTEGGLKETTKSGDHPRMRGEHEQARFWLWFWAGSSPHARGTLAPASSTYRAVGIIPACAGNTPAGFILPPTGGDHPRMRGEHTKKIA